MKIPAMGGGGIELKHGTVTGNPSTNGNIVTDIPMSKHIVSAYCTSLTGVVITMGESGGNWIFHLTTGAATPAVITTPNQTVDYYYFE